MRPDTELLIVVTAADGTTKTLDSHAPDPGDRPQNMQFGTQQASGFYTASFTLSCPIDVERNDIDVLNGVKFFSPGGDTAYEGFVASMPRSMDADGQATLTIACAGYMATASELSFTEIFVDRDLSRWREMSTTERVRLLGLGFGAISGAATTPDLSGRAVLRTGATGPWTPGAPPYCAAVYDAGSNTAIGKVVATWTRGANVSAADPLWVWQMVLADDDTQAGSLDTSGDLQAAGPDTETLTATTSTRRCAMLEFYYGAAAGTDGIEYAVEWSDIAVYGNHGLDIIGDAPGGVAASDVIRHVAGRCCPLLSTAGVQDTTYAIHQLAFGERTTPYDCFLKVNNYHLLPLAVWEDRTLHYGPAVDLTDWDWEVRHDVSGTAILLQGDEYTDRRNAIIVQYPDLQTGTVEELLPENHPELRDDSLDNPYNRHGRTRTGEPYVVPFPTTAANALQLGRIQLLEDNQAKAPGSFTCKSHVVDRAGVPQPAWKVRAGQRIRLTSTANLSDRPRLIHETSYDHASRTVTIGVDSTFRLLNALVDRAQTALQAAGLG